MAEKTGISWTDATFNPWIGCEKVSAGCKNCYAETERITRFRQSQTGKCLWGAGSHREKLSDLTWKNPHKWNRKAQREGKRLKVFCASLCDIFEDHPQVEEERKRLWETIRSTPYLDWQLLTKRPENIEKYLPSGYWQNVWLGVTVENQSAVDRISILQQFRKRVPVLFISAEPLIGPVNVDLSGIDWMIIGGESGSNARKMELAWAIGLILECKTKRIPVFFKQLGNGLAADFGINGKGKKPEEWPEELQVQEFPKSHKKLQFKIFGGTPRAPRAIKPIAKPRKRRNSRKRSRRLIFT